MNPIGERWASRTENEEKEMASLVPIFNALLNKMKTFSGLSLWIFKPYKMEYWNENNSQKWVFRRNKNLYLPKKKREEKIVYVLHVEKQRGYSITIKNYYPIGLNNLRGKRYKWEMEPEIFYFLWANPRILEYLKLAKVTFRQNEREYCFL